MAPQGWSAGVSRRPRSYRLWGLLGVMAMILFIMTPGDKIRSLGSESLRELEQYSYQLPDAFHHPHAHNNDDHNDRDKDAATGTQQQQHPRIGLVSMAFGNDTAIYDRAIESHARHAARHQYPLFVLRRQVAEGYWSKTLYLISLLIQELSKPEATRLEWLMWFDADSVVLNREIPLGVFVPARNDGAFDTTDMVVAHDQWGMNSGVFFTRVHPRAVTILTKAFSYPMWRPDEDLKHAYDQRALDLTICGAEFQRNVLWAPRPFFNTRHEEVRPGTMFAHFYSDPDRPQHMQEWLAKSETGRDADMQIPYQDSYYPAQVEQFWSTARECRTLLQRGRDSIKPVTDQTLRKLLQDNLDRLDSACIWKTEDVDGLRLVIDEVKRATHW